MQLISPFRWTTAVCVTLAPSWSQSLIAADVVLLAEAAALTMSLRSESIERIWYIKLASGFHLTWGFFPFTNLSFSSGETMEIKYEVCRQFSLWIHLQTSLTLAHRECGAAPFPFTSAWIHDNHQGVWQHLLLQKAQRNQDYAFAQCLHRGFPETGPVKLSYLGRMGYYSILLQWTLRSCLGGGQIQASYESLAMDLFPHTFPIPYSTAMVLEPCLGSYSRQAGLYSIWENEN